MHRFIFVFVFNRFFGCLFHYIIEPVLLDTKYEFIIAGSGYHCLSQIAFLLQFIYPFRISIFRVLYKYTLPHYVSEAVE